MNSKILSVISTVELFVKCFVLIYFDSSNFPMNDKSNLQMSTKSAGKHLFSIFLIFTLACVLLVAGITYILYNRYSTRRTNQNVHYKKVPLDIYANLLNSNE